MAIGNRGTSFAYDSFAYDMADNIRSSTVWWGNTTKTFWRSPVFRNDVTGLARGFAALGESVERAYRRIPLTPKWNIRTTSIGDQEYGVAMESIVERPFGRLTRFSPQRPEAHVRKVFLAAPLSGHHATLIRQTVIGLLPHADVYVAEWRNARDIPVEEGNFDVEDYTLYLADYIKMIGPDVHVIAICQPAPLALAAVAHLAETDPAAQPLTLTLMGGPIDVSAAPTKVSEFSEKISVEQLANVAIKTVGSSYAGVGRKVYPGALQLASFMAMNLDKHLASHRNQIFNIMQGDKAAKDHHNDFYDEYLSVMDMTSEFYLSTVKRVFQDRQIARGTFTLRGQKVDPGMITKSAVIAVEGERDDITAPGQCKAVLPLLTGLEADQKEYFLAKDAGHYGIFSGSAWRENVLPHLLTFMDKHTA
jgi:poly(3-hydroxybutyrate) depolymerase